MALAQINVKPKQPKKSGGLFGKIAGAIAGGVTALATGGAALPLVGAGAALGQAAGQAIKPGEAGQQRGIGMSRLAETDPKQQFLMIKKAQDEMLKENVFKPEEQEQYNQIFEKAKLKLKERF